MDHPTALERLRKNWGFILVLSIVTLLALYDEVATRHTPSRAEVVWSQFKHAARTCDHAWIEDGHVYANGCH